MNYWGAKTSFTPATSPSVTDVVQTHSEIARLINAKFHVAPPWEGGTKVSINGPGHMIKMASMPIYGKKYKDLLLQNQKSYDLESWHAASVPQVLQK